MKEQVLISICIPAYKRIDFLERLLCSILIQTFTNFEVIITDDSPDGSVKELCDAYLTRLPLQYFRNVKALGTPENWNEGMRRARGQWIKLMHDDDWFASAGSLQAFVQAINEHQEADFIFSAYTNVSSDKRKVIRPGVFRLKQLQQDPASLLSKNIIGPPSVVIHRNNGHCFYDNQLKWLVDIEFYIRYLAVSRPPVKIDQPLVNIGIHQLQVTQESALNPAAEIPEHLYVLNKMGIQHLSNILFYDAYWRLIRNMHITRKEVIAKAGYRGKIPALFLRMVGFQRRLPYNLLKAGVFSKFFMLCSYILLAINSKRSTHSGTTI